MHKKFSNIISARGISSLWIADALLVYTMLAPIIYLFIGWHLNLAPNIYRTMAVLTGPGIVACAVYLKKFHFRDLARNKWILLSMMVFSLVYIISGIRNFDNSAARESLKFFIGWCAFGFCLGTISNMSVSRSKTIFNVWSAFVIGFVFYGVLSRWAKLYRKFRLDGINDAQIGTMFYYFAMSILFYFGITRKILARIILIAAFIACFILGFYSGTRTAFFGFLIVFVLYLLFYSYINRKKLYPIAIGCLLIITFLALMPNMSQLLKLEHTKTLKQFSNLVSYLTSDDPTFNINILRIQIWKIALNEFKENPILGSGVGISYHVKNLNKDFVHPHNIILELLSETGVVGFIAFVILFGLISKRAVYIYKKIDPEHRMTFLFYPFSMLFFFLYSTLHTDLSTEYFKWYFAGMITGFQVNGDTQTEPTA